MTGSDCETIIPKGIVENSRANSRQIMKFKSWKWSEKKKKRALPKSVSSQGDCMCVQSYTLGGSPSRSSHSEVNKHITKTWRWGGKQYPDLLQYV